MRTVQPRFRPPLSKIERPVHIHPRSRSETRSRKPIVVGWRHRQISAAPLLSDETWLVFRMQHAYRWLADTVNAGTRSEPPEGIREFLNSYSLDDLLTSRELVAQILNVIRLLLQHRGDRPG